MSRPPSLLERCAHGNAAGTDACDCHVPDAFGATAAGEVPDDDDLYCEICDRKLTQAEAAVAVPVDIGDGVVVMACRADCEGPVSQGPGAREGFREAMVAALDSAEGRIARAYEADLDRRNRVALGLDVDRGIW